MKDATTPQETGFDPAVLATNISRAFEHSKDAMMKYKAQDPSSVEDMTKTLGQVAHYWMKDPEKAMQAQTQLFSQYMGVFAHSMKMFSGEASTPVVQAAAKDNRFKDKQWDEHPMYDFLKQIYLVTSNWAEDMVQGAELESHTKHKAEFYMKQISAAIAPSNFALTNPEVLRQTFESNGENLVRGMKMLAEDIEKGEGELKLRQSDDSPFVFGQNIASTKGKVVFENDLIQLIQYEPTTPNVGKVPLLIMPPWINKFYILDLTPEKSFIKYAVDKGLTVFVISWVNPDGRHAQKDFASYMFEGPLAALEAVQKMTGEKQAHMIGYCVGGTLLASTLAYLAAKKKNPVKSATFFTTQVDFTHAGDLAVFVDEEALARVKIQMAETGYLAGKKMASAFNSLRANDLIWPYVIKNYLKGEAPTAFDLLYWNADSTRMPAANHNFYLRHCYLQNDLSQKRMVLDGVTLDLSKVKVPVYNLAAREDHIAPAISVFEGCKFFGGDVQFVMGGSGHIAGVVNPESKGKYQFWTGEKPEGVFADWVSVANETKGSWWPHWRAWIASQDGKEVDARVIEGGIEDAPGRYVTVRD
jgi:polyhydroxyalkanoate synthase subunit PhaC